ncbi:CDP-2,3-bis-(O-geranylgeranyl)-sn-glycerol synthase [Candidatus Methanocrinis natronophilus]|uniref:CDP-archaeol synthase n=1 Tax=Candidatus Methanocrinis natronophilus TaxID=3033396 RepID=A0ABT5X922_9EURY|nr:CDP-2,3-bis-(O-geranylgeranyl)-sn-glycerol synthase [Candidatus Methanocrinis natronophilus]MDF0591199.1 CDP-2,3-bis-(O-geranylgeranyl)-sn-glycerol synthase [Candidatus Methanocrinis natronophilus]
MNLLIVAIWLMLPAYLPNNFAAFFGGGRPLDFGRTFSDGRRILGDGKTFRGTIIGVLGGVGVGIALSSIALFRPDLDLPQFGSGYEMIPVLLGLSLGAMAGDIVASFFKRRMGMERGAALFLVDQLDFVIGSWALTFLLAPVWFSENFTLEVMLVVLIVTPVLHRATNIIGYKMKAKKEPW